MRRALLLCASIAFAIACGDSATEPVPTRTPSAPPVSFATSSSEDGLSITTDKDDYAPGDTVWFTGSGWPANDVLDILLEDEPATHPPHSWTVTVSDDGTFNDSTYVVDVGDLGVTFTLTATSRLTGQSLTVTFTDAVVLDEAATFTPTSPVIGGTFSAQLTASFNGAGGTWKGTEWWIDNGTKTCVNTSDFVITLTPPQQEQHSVTLTALATPTPVGSHTLHVQLYSSDNCSPGSGPSSTKVGGQKDYTFNSVNVSNNPPTADAGGPYSGNEGASIQLDGSGSTDNDGTIASYQWSIVSFSGAGASCSFVGDVSTGVSPSVSCNDNGTLTVNLTVTDDDGAGSQADQASITVNNVAPTATLNAPSPVNEGTAIALSFATTNDVSSVDMAAGFTYAFDCGSGYGAYSGTASASCPTTDGPETRNVAGKIRDKDLGEREYLASVVVDNVKPTISSVTASGLNASNQLVLGSGNEASTTVTVAFTDPAGALDAPYTTNIDCGNGTSHTGTPTTYGSSSGSCTYTVADVGLNTISVTVTDDDGAASVAATKVVQVIYNWTGFFQPVDNENLNVAKAGSAIPIKFNLGGNQGLAIFYVGDPNPYPNSSKVNCSAILEDQDTIEETVNAGGSSLTYDPSANQYVYVWKTDKAWGTPGTCRRLDVKLNDGTTHSAYFKFNK